MGRRRLLSESEAEPFRYDAEVNPGEKRYVRYEVSETCFGDPVEIPVTVINGEASGLTVFMTAGVQGDELNGVKVLQDVAAKYDPLRAVGRSSACTS